MVMCQQLASTCSLRFQALRKLLMGLIVVTVVTAIAYLLALPQIQSLTNRNTETRSRLPQTESIWQWSCDDRQCIRREWNQRDSTSQPLMSLAECRITCGSTSVIWPQVTGNSLLGNGSYTFDPAQLFFQINRRVDRTTKSLLQEAFDIFKENLYALVPSHDLRLPRSASEVTVTVTVFLRGDRDLYLTMETDESYRLEVESEAQGKVTVTIVSNSFFGARHALETLSQLIWWNKHESASGPAVGFKILNYASVDDAPYFQYRGLMVDTSRNFMSIPALRNTINGMAAAKLNTLHLHLTDSQSFSFTSPRYPQMSRLGAYSPEQVYSAKDMEELADYARVRGVRVLPEVDAPAHAGPGWQWGEYQGLGKLAVCVNQQPWSRFCGEPPCGQLNPTNNNTYHVLRGIYQDLIELTRVTDMFHLGGDEVNMECWLSSPDVFKKSIPKHLSRDAFDNKVTEFHNRAFNELTTANGGVVIPNSVVWSTGMEDDVMQRMFPQEHYIIQEWGVSTWAQTRNHLNLNYRVIISHVDAWYLDCGYGSWIRGQGEACGPIASWQKVYDHRPWSEYAESQRSLVVGGEACLWSEKADEHSLDTRLWPRASALAERLWSDPSHNRKLIRGSRRDAYDADHTRDVMLRLAMHRERLVSRGIRAEVLWPQWCNENPESCL